jgi:Icc-related predicted phosphoesterase
VTNVKLLAFGDIHLKGSGQTPAYEQLSLPADIDGIVTVGDVVHRVTTDDMGAGRTFFREITDHDVPVYTVPGNHDPASEHEEMIAPVDGVELLHDERRTVGDFDIVGWGCDEFDIRPEVTTQPYRSLDPTAQDGPRRYAADQSAERLEDALFSYLTSDSTRDDLEATLSIAAEERATFHEQLDEFDSTYDEIRTLLEDAGESTILLSHVPPYGTELDRHHSIGERELDLDELHVGSIALKLALRIHRPAVALSGHSHRAEYESLTSDGPTVSMLNLGFQGVVTMEYDPNDRTFGYERHTQ